jgi:hypothetical protein
MSDETVQVEGSTPEGGSAQKESLLEFEARVSSEGYTVPEETSTNEETQVEAEVPPAEEPKGPDLAQVLAGQAEATKRQTELLEQLAKVRSEVTKTEPPGPNIVEQYKSLLTDRHKMAEAMRHEDIDLDPTSRKDVALFRNMVSHELEREERRVEREEAKNRIEALENKLKGWETAAQAQQKARQVEASWTEATKDYTVEGETAETLYSAVSALVSQGTEPKVAVSTVLKPFLKLLPKKAPEGVVAQANDPNVARALAAAAVTGKGANRSGAFKRGTTTSASLKDFEKSFFREDN